MQFKLRKKTVKFESQDKVVGTCVVQQATLFEAQLLDEMQQDALTANIEQDASRDLEAKPYTIREIKERNFRVNIYPYMAACTISGDIATAEAAFAMPDEELDKWWIAARECNPKWFEAIDLAIEAMSSAELKKKVK